MWALSVQYRGRFTLGLIPLHVKDLRPLTTPATYSPRLHQSLHAFLANAYTLLTQGLEYPWTPINTTALLVNGNDLIEQLLILLDPARWLTFAPVIVSARRHIQPIAQMDYFVSVSVSLDELVALRRSSARNRCHFYSSSFSC